MLGERATALAHLVHSSEVAAAACIHPDGRSTVVHTNGWLVVTVTSTGCSEPSLLLSSFDELRRQGELQTIELCRQGKSTVKRAG